MWVKYSGEITYNSINVREFQPNTSRSLSEEVGTHLIKKFPKLFKRAKEEETSGSVEKVETIKEEKFKEVKK